MHIIIHVIKEKTYYMVPGYEQTCKFAMIKTCIQCKNINRATKAVHKFNHKKIEKYNTKL